MNRWEVMMSSRADDIRKRMAKRKKEMEKNKPVQKKSHKLNWLQDEERHGFDQLPSYDRPPHQIKTNHPLFKKEIFLFKVLASACLFLVVAIMFKNDAALFEKPKAFVADAMDKNFQFATVIHWYEEQFGQSFALLPKQKQNEELAEETQPSLPATGKVLQEFEQDGQKISIETNMNEKVEASNGGVVEFIGEKPGFGQTVIIQHADQSQTWYGNLAEIDVKAYDYVEKGAEVGQADAKEDGKGLFYFAIKKGDDFVDPSQVIPFE